MIFKVIGYYGHNNIGYEQYKFTINKLLNYNNSNCTSNNVEFLDCNQLTSLDETDIIIFGGGSILCDYFVDKLLNVFQNKPNKIIALSVDLPSTDILLKTNKLDRFDHIFLRNIQDFILFSKFYNPNKISYLPDTSCLLAPLISCTHSKLTTSRKLVSITLSDTSLINDIIHFIAFIIKRCNCKVVLTPFNKEEDTKAHNLLVNLFSHELVTKLPYTNFVDTWNTISQADIVLSMRYHGLLFAIHNKIPWIPLSNTRTRTSRKIQNLISDSRWTFDPWIGEKFNYEKLITSFYSLISGKNYVISSLDILPNQCISTYSKICSLSHPTSHPTSNPTSHPTSNVLYHQKKVEDVDYETKVKYLNYIITGSFSSDYKYDLKFDVDEISWIINDYFKKNVFSLPKPMLILPQPNFKICSSPDWKFVYDNLMKFNNENSDILLDLYIDETFQCNYKVNKLLEIIPYKQKWYGFIHNNWENLMKNEDFITSLMYCKGLIVFSKYLKNLLENDLLKNGLKIPVYNIVKPTWESEIKFSIKKFVKNDTKLILNIGTCSYSFYNLNISLTKRNFWYVEKHINIKKAALNSNYISLDALKPFYLYDDISKIINSVELIQDDYNELLSQNIVFISNYSSLDVLTECIIRNTPIIINDHPSVVEILGSKYPLYIKDDCKLINLTMKKINKAHKYLVKLDKTNLNIDTFISGINNILHVSS